MEPNFEKRDGFIIAIIQDAMTRQVLMHAFMNKEAWNLTLKTGKVVFWSTSRNELWPKGATSGNTMKVKSMTLDCDCDCVLILVEMKEDGVACHNGTVSCFEQNIVNL